MDKTHKSAEDEVSSKLPPGFRFQPTDKEMVFQYLARKIFSCPLPASVIPEISIFSFDPLTSEEVDSDKYFFSSKSDHCPNGDIIPTCNGFWKAVGSDKWITCPKKLPFIGIRRTLMFFKGKHQMSTEAAGFTLSELIMHEYCITLNSLHGSLIPIGNWVLCHSFFKRSGMGDTSETDDDDVSSSSCSSSSSCISDSTSVLIDVSSTNNL